MSRRKKFTNRHIQPAPKLSEKQQEIIDLKTKFIELYPEKGTVGATLRAIGLKSRNSFYDWLANDPEFKANYDNELQPNRRDEVASTIYQAAQGKIKLGKDQLTAAFGFLRATEAGKSKKHKEDDLVFTEHSRQDVNLNPDGKPIESVVRVVDA